jgi:hypothetical protein
VLLLLLLLLLPRPLALLWFNLLTLLPSATASLLVYLFGLLFTNNL